MYYHLAATNINYLFTLAQGQVMSTFTATATTKIPIVFWLDSICFLSMNNIGRYILNIPINLITLAIAHRLKAVNNRKII
ncbi:hypothetical protein FLSI110296_06190 [Flavobacterium sinopsychrotolerans]|uniref:Uncharacterized protein n=1 Tax=Flavobacterium sinopsychrotolerans TaxID=604089 RepID=A0A1H8LBW5_9FLAO|nr:hypothetical protein [Flavobacterium sinopsychrotolerans]SEO02670.1 hypothetical protein SAMN04487942_1616 [Flavobacterium sinopsychrotolerans]